MSITVEHIGCEGEARGLRGVKYDRREWRKLNEVRRAWQEYAGANISDSGGRRTVRQAHGEAQSAQAKRA
jgi:hypothetical protein